MGSIRRIAAASAAGAALAAGLTAATAQAAQPTAVPAAATSQHSEVEVKMPMKIAGFDPAIAKAHGYEIRTDAQGHEYSVKIGAEAGSTAAQVTPDNSLSGNCGTSYLWYSAIGNQAASLDTGFDGIPSPAIAYTWKVSVTDAIGTGVVTWAGPLALRGSWEGSTVTHHGTTGYSIAKVTTGVVYLDDGSYCVTLQPSDYTYLY